MGSVLYFDPLKNFSLSWENIVELLRKEGSFSPYVIKKSYDDIYLQIVNSLVLDEPVILLDTDFSEKEISDLGITSEQLSLKLRKSIVYPESVTEFVNSLSLLKNWSLTLFTSGTTGLPKKVVHSFASITRGCKISEEYKNQVWGWAYNPTHMAGIQVFFQALLNKNKLVMLFNRSREIVLSTLAEEKITHLSATPTFFRMLLPLETAFNEVKNITFGGEKMDKNLIDKLKINFPNALFRNVYASTEAGSLFSSQGEYFKINERLKHFIKFVENEIYLHKSLLGQSDSLTLEGDWYKTGDLVEFMDEKNELFRFLSRKNEMINVGGYKVNPNEVEEILNSHPNIIMSRVFGKKNAVVGNLIVAEVVSNSVSLSEKEIRDFLQDKLQAFKVPRIITFVDKIELTRSGKKSLKT
jgi:acyl-CoA synthetase (AMP-forming)/AMP-acid ligase II